MIFALGSGRNFRPPHGPEIVPVLDRFFYNHEPLSPQMVIMRAAVLKAWTTKPLHAADEW